MTLKTSITAANVADAAERLRGIAHRTPVLTSRYANAHTNAQVFLKCENFQRAGAFKFRGAYNALCCLTDQQKRQGVIAYSSGNHAQAVALAGQLLGIRTTIVMPYDAPAVKAAATRGYGAEIISYHREHESRQEIAARVASERGLTIIPPFDHPHVIAGQGTAAWELIQETGELDYLFVCVGGGGLIAGCALAAKYLSPGCIVVGVEPEQGNDAMQSLQCGKIVEIAVPKTIADGAQTQRIGELVFPILSTHVREILTVTDDQLCVQMRFFFERMKIVVEPTGCLAAAAAMDRKIDLTGKRVGVIVSGGNVDSEVFSQCLARSR